jgi:outer membrane protein, multidrug efflux system
MKILSQILVVLFLTACAVGPDYERPAVPTDTAYAEKSDSIQAISSDWWKGLGDEKLNDLVVTALKANTDIRIAAARVEQAIASFEDISGAQLPQIDGSAGYSKTKISQGGYTPISADNGRNRSLYRAGLSTSFELDFWGKLRRATEGARAQLLAAEGARTQVELAITSSVVRTYAVLRSTDVQWQAAQEVVRIRQEEQRIIEEKFKVGSAGASDRAQAEVNLAAAISGLSDAARNRAQAEHQLGFLIGQPNFTVSEKFTTSLKLPPPPAAGLPSDLLRRRPDVFVAEQNLITANATIGYVKAAYFPTFSLTGTLGNESRELNGLFSSSTSTSSVGLGLNIPLLDFGRTTSRVEGAVAARNQAATLYEKTVLNAFREVRDALVDVRETLAAAQAAERRESSAQEAFRVAQARQKQGQISPMEFLTARRLLAESQASVARVRFDRLGAQVDLIKALGGAPVDFVPATK